MPSGLVHADGVDTSLSQRIGRSLTVAAGYSYWDVSEYNLEKNWIRADYDIRHQGRIWAVWHGGKRWTASVLWRYAAGRPYTPYDVAASIKARAGRLDRTKTNALTYDDYHRLDVRAERLFVTGRTAVTVFGEVDQPLQPRQHPNVRLVEHRQGPASPSTSGASRPSPAFASSSERPSARRVDSTREYARAVPLFSDAWRFTGRKPLFVSHLLALGCDCWSARRGLWRSRRRTPSPRRLHRSPQAPTTWISRWASVS